MKETTATQPPTQIVSETRTIRFRNPLTRLTLTVESARFGKVHELLVVDADGPTEWERDGVERAMQYLTRKALEPYAQERVSAEVDMLEAANRMLVEIAAKRREELDRKRKGRKA